MKALILDVKRQKRPYPHFIPQVCLSPLPHTLQLLGRWPGLFQAAQAECLQ